MATASQLEASEAWRKAGFMVRPFHGHDEEDAKRFHQQILMALDGEMLSVSSGINYTMGDVARGDDGFRTSAQPAEDALAWFVANECGGATPAPRVNDYKHEMRTLTIIGEAGYRVGSINSFSNALDLINAKITDPADRMTEHDRTELILNAVMSANQGAVSDDALKEYNRPAAARLYLQPNAGVAAAAGAPPNPPAGARSQQQVVSALSKLWDSQVRAGMMMIHGVSRTRVVGGT